MKKVDKSSSAGTEAELSTNADVSHVSQPIAKPNVVGSLSFKEELQQNIIPAIDRMIGKEREHLKWLESNLGKSVVVVEFYNTSKKVLAHLERRLIEYIDYAKKL